MTRLPFALFLCAALLYGAGLQPPDVFELESATDPRISPDGRHVVYVRGFADIGTDQRHSNLWIVNTDGSGHRPLTTGNYTDTSPRWSPDGTRLLYLSNREGGGNQIYMRWMDSGQTAKLTSIGEPPSVPTWSPDGKQIAFFALVPAEPRKIGKLPVAPPGAKWADPPKLIDRITYRFDGQGYLKEGWTHAFVMPADGRTPKQVTTGNFAHTAWGRTPNVIAWTSDSRALVLSVNRNEDADFAPLESDIWEYPIHGGQPRKLSSRQGPDNEPAVSPDGRLVAFSGFEDRKLGYQIRRLSVMNRDGGAARVLTASLDRDAAGPVWAADNSGVYFFYADQGNTKLGFQPVDGPFRPITGSIANSGQFSVARDGSIALIRTRPDLPGDIAVLRKGESQPRVLTSVNEDLLSQRTLGAVEEIWYNSSKDGRKIHGWIIKPPGFDPSRKYPLILEIHGGPFSFYGDRFDLEKQMMAAAGYVVLYTNPRGSTSYGEDFGNLIHHNYPSDDFHDLVSGVDAVIARGYIDPNNLFVTGGSGGGVLTCWVIGNTTRFRAAASLYPVIDWTSFLGTTDIGPFALTYWFPGLPWDHGAHYDKRSLLSVVKNVKTPTLIMTGEEDYRTPISESEQYYRALKLLKVETVLIRVPGEPHGISRRPSHHAQKIAHITGWFDEHKAK
ncbi:MAG: S9 family peptidase [Bryobacteraceae bacterium]|nr:S9 family peptidase [Bryobacteraceae bacterium]